jgi:hypothetical protein
MTKRTQWQINTSHLSSKIDPASPTEASELQLTIGAELSDELLQAVAGGPGIVNMN